MNGAGPLTPARKARLALEIAATFLRVRRRVADRDLRNVISALRDEPLDAVSPSAADPAPIAARLANATRRTLRLLPGDTRCLSQSLVLSSLLARRGISSRLVIGVTPGDEFGAHAWVERDEIPLLPSHEREFERLTEL